MEGSLKYLLQKEFIQFRRNKFLPRLIFFFPVVVMLIAPIVANMDVKGVKVAFVDYDGSSLSGKMVSHLDASEYFKVALASPNYEKAYELLEDGKVDVIVTVPAHFEAGIIGGTKPKIKVDANGVNATKGMLGSRYVMVSLAGTLQEAAAGMGMGLSSENNLSVCYFYNPTQDYRRFMAPGFILLLVMLVCCFIPALNLVLEKEKGTIEQINVTPVTTFEFTLSKLIPYWIIGLVVLTEGILTIGLIYGLWPAGSWGALYLAAVLFSLAMSGFGVAIAGGSDTMQQCIFVLFFFVMIFMLMSGLFTPVGSMPSWAQKVTYAFPPRHFIDILRSVYLKGTTMAELWVSYLALGILAVLFCSLSALTYKKRG